MFSFFFFTTPKIDLPRCSGEYAPNERIALLIILPVRWCLLFWSQTPVKALHGSVCFDTDHNWAIWFQVETMHCGKHQRCNLLFFRIPLDILQFSVAVWLAPAWNASLALCSGYLLWVPGAFSNVPCGERGSSGADESPLHGKYHILCFKLII